MLSVFRIITLLIILSTPSLSHANGETATKILLFGDSIVAGYDLPEDDSLAVQLEQSLKEDNHTVQVINGGVSGDTTSSGRSRLSWLLTKHQPDIVLLALGGNDVLRGFSPDITKENLDAMLGLLKEGDVDIMFSKVQAPQNLGDEYKKQFDAIYTDLAAKYDIKLYPFLLENTFGNKALMQQDQIHPNKEGVAIIAQDIKQHLKDF